MAGMVVAGRSQSLIWWSRKANMLRRKSQELRELIITIQESLRAPLRELYYWRKHYSHYRPNIDSWVFVTWTGYQGYCVGWGGGGHMK